MNQEINTCDFCRKEKAVSRQYLHAKNHFQSSGDGFKFIYFCADCGLKEFIFNHSDASNDDQGQLELEKDMVSLVSDVWFYEFHDFKNSAYSLPKVALIERLQAIILKTKEGKYDNVDIEHK